MSPVSKIYTYLFNHYKEKITLREIADYVKQNPSAAMSVFPGNGQIKAFSNVLQKFGLNSLVNYCRILI